jgi:hypothetical protein
VACDGVGTASGIELGVDVPQAEASASASGGSTLACCSGAAPDALAVTDSFRRSGTSTRRRSAKSSRRLPHGKPNPGRPVPSTPKVNFSSSK